MTSLATLLRAAAASTPTPSVADRASSSSLADVLRRAEELAEQVRASAVRRTPVVVVALPSSADAVLVLLAAVVGDLTVCFRDPAGDAARLAKVVEQLDPDAVIDRDGLRARRPATDESLAAGYVSLSSGSTGGPPKGVLSTWECLADFAAYGAAALQLEPGMRWAEPSHPSYDLAMTNWLLALTSGASLHVSDALADRMRPLRFVARVEATHLRLAPRFVDLALAEHARGTEAHTLRVWASGGDRLSLRHARDVLGLGVPTLVNTYGTSESAGFASAIAFTSPVDLSSCHGVVAIGDGRVGEWRTELIEEASDGGPLDLLAVRSPHVGTGYLLGATGAAYPRWEPGRVVTGDLGARVGDQLFCLGRSGRLVKRSATFVNLDDVDSVLREQGSETFTVATRTGSLVTLVAGAATSTDVLGALLASRLSPDLHPDAFVPVARLPRLDNGKSDHVGALRLAEEGLARLG